MKKKYIIALDDRNVWTCGLPAKTLLLSDVSIFGTDLSSVNTGIELTPYTEPDTEKVREEAYKRGREDAIDAISSKEQSIADKAYQSGLSDAWEAAKKIGCYEIDGGYPVTQMLDLFDRDDLPKIMSDYTASEAIEKIRQYEQEKEEQIQVGDEVEFYDGGTAIWMCDNPNEDAAYLMFSDGSCGSHENSEIIRKTGRHFPEIAEVLRKMMEE